MDPPRVTQELADTKKASSPEDSRVCSSNILGFQPGDAFVVCNVANLVPLFETGPTETKAALDFSVNTLKVENILVVGHSCCGGIHALMGMPDEDNSRSFIRSWVVTVKNAKVNTKAAASNLSFDLQCRHWEKPLVYRRGSTPCMTMMPMLLPDGRIGYVLQQPGAQPCSSPPPPQQQRGCKVPCPNH
ncbi:hypothetical protein POM88_004988 [Heracleum sosnowskyi]|uniref:Carbonic anhydrase n=1 Tax=Heracleum sosnowskyi TaxID=360622 RepID=A0AAD8JKG1_9APIA|nr:hypothetical protein POM88_004988 [Heracleum sosnowskyi]